MWEVGEVVLAHNWAGKLARWNGWGVKIIAPLGKRKARSPVTGAEYELTSYRVQAPNGDVVCAAPSYLKPLAPPLFRDDLKTATWSTCHWQPPHLR
jgi:hypothetical protein